MSLARSSLAAIRGIARPSAADSLSELRPVEGESQAFVLEVQKCRTLLVSAGGVCP